MQLQEGAPVLAKNTGATNQPVTESLLPNDTTESALVAGYPALLDTEEIGAILKVRQATVRELLRQGKLRSLRVGKQYRVAKIWLVEFINNGGK